MPSLAEQLRERSRSRSRRIPTLADRLRERRGGSPGPSSSGQSLPELEAQAAELEVLRDATGAPGIAQTAMGAGRAIIDVLSRPNYAIAGLAEELAKGRSVSAGVTRAMAEIFSGVGPIQGQKRAFGEVMEGFGVGTHTLAEMFPGLEGTWVGNFGSRGAAGLALDIALDPLTYMTFGASGAGKILAKVGGKPAIRFLNKAGLAERAKVTQEVMAAMGPDAHTVYRRFAQRKYGVTDDFSQGRAALDLTGEIDRRTLERVTDATGELLPTFADPGGVKLFGQHVAKGKTLREFSAPMIEALARVPGGDEALEGARQFGEGLLRATRQLFSPAGELANLPPAYREAAMRLRRDFMHGTAAHRGRLLSTAKTLEQTYRELEKADPLIGKRWYDIREGVRPNDLTGKERETYEATMGLYDSMRDTLVAHGVLEPEQVARVPYIHHHYKNLQELDQYHWHTDAPAPFNGMLSEQFTKERAFDKFEDAVIESRRLNSISLAGGESRIYPVLEPDYDVFGNLSRYIDRHAEALGRKAWREEVLSKFGKPVEIHDINAHYDLARPALRETSREYQQIEAFFDETPFFRDSADKIEEVFDVPSGVGTRAGRKEIEQELVRDVRLRMAKASTNGKREIIRQLLTRSRHSSDLAFFERALWDDYKQFFPRAQGWTAGEVSQPLAKTLGEKAAQMIPAKSAWTADRGVMLPRAIWDDLHKVNSKLLNTQDFKDFGRVLDAFDWLNNKFKLGVYTFWPASMVRDGYNNIANSMLDIGVQALNPRHYIDAIGVMARKPGEMVTAQGVRWSWDSLREMARDFGVWVPGEQFAELTGKAGGPGSIVGKPIKVLGGHSLVGFRGLIDNEARMALWLANIRRGVDPRAAADHVHRFLFDYAELSQAEREVFRRLIPFYTFTRKNVALQVDMLRRNPGMQINQLKPFRGRTDENEQMVQWEAEALKMRMDRDGKTVRMLTGIDMPLRNMEVLWRGDLHKTGRGVMGMVTPVIKTWPEILLNHDFFLGRDLTRTESGMVGRALEALPAPAGLKDWLGYKKDIDAAGRPRYSFDGRRFTLLFRSWMFSRAISTSDRQFREYMADGGFEWQKAALDVLTGIRQKDVDMDEQMKRRTRERIAQLEQSLARRGVLLRYEKRYKPANPGELR